jgi:hypothetical protein
LEGSQGVLDQSFLHFGFVLLARGVAQGKVDEGCPGRSHRARDGEGARHTERGNSGFFELPGDQSDRLMADGSDGNQQRDIGPLVDNAFHQGGREFLAYLARRVDSTHKREGLGGHGSEASLVDE